MRAQRASMISAGGTAKLKLATEEDFKSKSVITADNISKSYGDRTIIKPFSLRIQRGDRIGIVGANGAGKTTLLKMLTGELEPDSGSVEIAKTLTGVMIDQQRQLLTADKTVRQVLAEGGDWIDVRGNRKHVQAYLKDFLFDPKIVDMRVGVLSGGERSRLLLAREFAKASNLLVLDEPTNDLDLETLDLLQEVIADYEGTVLIVSHDRDFLDRTVTITLGLDGSGGSTWSRAAMRTGNASAANRSRARRRQPSRRTSPPRPHRRPPSPTSSPTRTSATTSCSPSGSRSWKPPSPRPKRSLPIPTSSHPIRSASRPSPRDRERADREGRGRGAMAGAGRTDRGVSPEEELRAAIATCRTCAAPASRRTLSPAFRHRAVAYHQPGAWIEGP